MLPARSPLVILLAASLLWAAPAFCLELSIEPPGPTELGQPETFTVVPTDAVGEVSYEWRFGDGLDFEVAGAEVSHVFTDAGLQNVDVYATDAEGNTASAYFRHLVHYPLTQEAPTSSTSIIYDGARNRVYSLNQDNDSVTAVDAETLEIVGELPVYRKPESLALTSQGKLWVVHQDDYAVAIVDPDSLSIEGGFRLPYASQPIGVAMSPLGDSAYISLMATGKLLKLDPATGVLLAEVEVGPRPRGIAVSHDGKDVYVTRFISPDAGGEVVKVAGDTMTVASRIVLRLDTETLDSDLRARGLPNYLFSVAITPDGRQAWIPAKKDNILRGQLLDGQDLTHDTTVRPLTCVIDTQSAEEIYESRVDLDNRSMPFQVQFSPYGNLAILALPGSNRVEVRDVFNPTQVFSAVGDAGKFPRATVLTPNGRLFVQAQLSRQIIVYDMNLMLDNFDQSTPALLAEIDAVQSEKLPEQVLLGKQIFHNAEDSRMAFEGYISCGSCHFEGIEDGRVWDFSTRGEGLRNTVTLLGRKGMGQGRLNWTGVLDEVQDFENQMREFFKGTGFLSDEEFETGTRSDPLGDPKAGLNPELDALAAYVSSFDHVNPSPYRNPDGSLTREAEAGQVLYEDFGCDFCHGGPEFSDSERGTLHDVGTITASSGTRAGKTLFGFDTPSLLGVWETPPYLHDGSAKTLREVLTTQNHDGLHGFLSRLLPEEFDQLEAYLLQIDGEQPIQRLPFDPPDFPQHVGTGGSSDTNGNSDTGEDLGEPDTGSDDATKTAKGCGCVTPGSRRGLGSGTASLCWFLASLVLLSARRRRSALDHDSPSISSLAQAPARRGDQ